MSKIAILAISEPLNFNFCEFLHFLEAEICQTNKNLVPTKMAKTAFLELLDYLKLISRKF